MAREGADSAHGAEPETFLVGGDEVSGGGGEDESLDAVTVALPRQLRDRATHRIADRDERVDAEPVGERSHVVGAIGEGEVVRVADAASVTAMVERDHAEPFTECGVTGEPVEVRGGCPAVQEDDDGCTGGPRDLAVEGGAPSDQFDVTTGRQAGTVFVDQFETFTMDTETLAPFSSVIETLSPADPPRRADPMGETGLMTSIEGSVVFSSMWPMR